MVKVVILGSTGNVGQYVLKKLQSIKDCKITVLVRDINKLKKLSNIEGITIKQGDVLNVENLKDAFKEQEVVFAGLTGDFLKFSKNIVEASKSEKIRRIIWLTGLGIHAEVPGSVGEIIKSYALKYPEYIQAADFIANSGIDYTLIRAPQITNGNNEKYFIQKEGEDIHSSSCDRVAIALFVYDMINNLDLGRNQSLGITN